MKHILTLLVVLMMLTTPVLAVGEKVAYNGTVEDFTTYDKVLTEKEMQNVTLSKAIDNAPAELAGKIKADSLKASEIKITKDSRGLVMSADLPKGQDEVEITLTPDAIAEIPNCDGEVFYVHRFDDDGNYVSVQEVKVNKEGDTKYVTKFSENILNGFSGYYEVTQTLESGQSLTLPEGAERVDVSVGGSVPEYAELIENNPDIYHGSPLLIMPMDNATNIVSGATASNYDVIFQNSTAIFNGTTSYLEFPNLNGGANTENNTMFVRFVRNSATIQPLFSTMNTNAQGYVVYVYNSKINIGARGTSPTTSYKNYVCDTTLAIGTSYRVFVFYSTNAQPVVYVNGVLQTVTESLSSGAYPFTINDGSRTHQIGRGQPFNTNAQFFSGTVSTLVYYDYLKDYSDISILNNLHLGFSGIQISSTPYTGGTLTLSPTTSVEYVATDGLAREVTARAFFTEDTTLIGDAQTAEYQNISIVHTAGNNTTSGLIAYQFNTSYLGTPVLESNNTNATVGKNNTHVTISTGELVEGQTFYYNVSIPKASSGSPVNPSFAKPAGIFVAIAGAFAAGVGYFANRRRM
jgi:hypothetical protein